MSKTLERSSVNLSVDVAVVVSSNMLERGSANLKVSVAVGVFLNLSPAVGSCGRRN